MSLIDDINDYFFKYGLFYDMETINYTKQVVHNIKTSSILEKFMTENNITAKMLLNEMTPYVQYKYNNYGNTELDMSEMEAILNIILFSNELENLIIDEHVKISSIDEFGDLSYIADEYATDYLNDKFGLDVVEGDEFNFSILEDDENDSDNNFNGFKLN